MAFFATGAFVRLTESSSSSKSKSKSQSKSKSKSNNTRSLGQDPRVPSK